MRREGVLVSSRMLEDRAKEIVEDVGVSADSFVASSTAVDPVRPQGKCSCKLENADEVPEALANRVYTDTNIAEHAGYIVSKDRRIVVFYTNDLKSTMSAKSLPSTSLEAVCMAAPTA
ncbi:Hypothetical protein PHPALM_613 [Phytophthora palmivora]|uniref:Uncharacterized protein n=1 Tax=Phytophthora palmivora TaxID=4796 RepID=A0A2P4YUH0_9STRA|nr:Hypothetical protein PHPALM_613 [Phytophthora palmivora]